MVDLSPVTFRTDPTYVTTSSSARFRTRITVMAKTVKVIVKVVKLTAHPTKTPENWYKTRRVKWYRM